MRRQKRPFFINPTNIDLILLDRPTRRLTVVFASGVRECIDVEAADLDAVDSYIGERILDREEARTQRALDDYMGRPKPQHLKTA